MNYKLRNFQVTYEATFVAPQFALLDQGTAARLLETLYANINPRFAINTKDMQAPVAQKVDEVRARVELFSGNGVIEVSASKFGALFKNAVSGQDWATIKDCVHSSVIALLNIFPDVRFKEESVNVTSILDLTGSASDLIRTKVNTKETIDAGRIGATNLHHGTHYEFENGEQKWLIVVDVQRNWAEPQALFVFNHSYFRMGEAVPTFEDKVDLVDKAIMLVLNGFGLVESQPTK